MNLQDNTNSLSEDGERRKNVRSSGPFLVQVRGVEAKGNQFKNHTLADNLSTGGLYMQLPRCLEPGSSIDVVIRDSDQEPPVRIVAAGIVRRVEKRSYGLYGLGVEFTRVNLLDEES
jgi:c-di-GMP-binding flagellar brake protein YcgR